jgi:predicted solute-binding protein
VGDLTYRGVRYHQPERVIAAQSETVQPVSVAVAQNSTQERARELLLGHTRKIKQRQQSMLTRTAMAIGLSEEKAAHYWNHIQGKVHPTFRKNYDRMGATMS